MLVTIHSKSSTSAFSLSPRVATKRARVGLEFSVANKKVTAPAREVRIKRKISL